MKEQLTTELATTMTPNCTTVHMSHRDRLYSYDTSNRKLREAAADINYSAQHAC